MNLQNDQIGTFSQTGAENLPNLCGICSYRSETVEEKCPRCDKPLVTERAIIFNGIKTIFIGLFNFIGMGMFFLLQNLETGRESGDSPDFSNIRFCFTAVFFLGGAFIIFGFFQLIMRKTYPVLGLLVIGGAFLLALLAEIFNVFLWY